LSYSETKTRAFASVKWALLASVLPRLWTPLVTLILARVLVPEDFALIGLATVFISFLQMVQQLGLGTALIQCQRSPQDVADGIFWINLLSSGLVYGVLWAAAGYIGAFYAEARLVLVVRVLGLQLILAALGAVHSALLERAIQYQKLFWPRIMPALVPPLLALSLAWAGMRHWALVAGSLAGCALQTALLWQQSAWVPAFRLPWNHVRSLLGFGLLASLETFVNWGHNYGDNAIAGRFLSRSDFGVYITSFSLVILVLGIAVLPVAPIAYASFSRLAVNRQELVRAYLQLNRLVALVCFPLAVGICVVATPFVRLAFKPQWAGMAPVLQILALMPGLSFLFLLNPELFRACGRPQINVLVGALSMGYMAVALLIAAPFGVVRLTWARFSVGAVFTVVHIYLPIRLLKLDKDYFWSAARSPAVAAALMALLLVPGRELMGPYAGPAGWAKLGCLVAGGAIIYAGAIVLMDRSLVRLGIQAVQRALIAHTA